MDRLSPCPFCGRKGKYISIAECCDDICNIDYCKGCDRMKYYTVVCNAQKGGCGASCGWKPTEEEAIEAWNTRRYRERARTMANCKDCIHYKPCFSGGQSVWNNIEQTENDHCKWLKTDADVAEVKHGKWHVIYSDNNRELVVCSICEKEYILRDGEEKTNYCPNCGAKMDGKLQKEG